MPRSEQILTSEGKSVAGTLDVPSGEASSVTWQQSLRQAIRSSAELYRRLGMEHVRDRQTDAAAQDFPVFVPLEYLRRIRPNDPSDPLLLQVLPTAAEQVQTVGFSTDPVGDREALKSTGLLHKYSGRALLITTAACAVHCRYCFRRHFPYAELALSGQARADTLQAILDDPSIHEILLSGGDPLTLPDAYLSDLIQDLASIPHLKRLRIHSRVPIVIPQRVTDSLLQALTATRLTTIFVVHVNHAQELDEPTLDALARLIDAGIPVLNQAVLLRGVNDNEVVLKDLCERLINHRILPYYLHQLDRVAGAAHFEVAPERGLELIESLRQSLPGYAVPRYVQENAGRPHKDVIG